MGLDSVEIIIRVEEYFDISIPDPEAGKINTVQDFADCVFLMVKINPSEKCKSQMLFYKLRKYFIDKQGFDTSQVRPDSKIKELITGDIQKNWADIEKYLNLKLPTLSGLDINPTKEKEVKLLGLTVWTRKSPVTSGTIGDLVNWILAQNYTSIAPNTLFDKGDVEKVIIGIISYYGGVSVNEIKPEHNISYDLGID